MQAGCCFNKGQVLENIKAYIVELWFKTREKEERDRFQRHGQLCQGPVLWLRSLLLPLWAAADSVGECFSPPDDQQRCCCSSTCSAQPRLPTAVSTFYSSGISSLLHFANIPLLRTLFVPLSQLPSPHSPPCLNLQQRVWNIWVCSKYQETSSSFGHHSGVTIPYGSYMIQDVANIHNSLLFFSSLPISINFLSNREDSAMHLTLSTSKQSRKQPSPGETYVSPI